MFHFIIQRETLPSQFDCQFVSRPPFSCTYLITSEKIALSQNKKNNAKLDALENMNNEYLFVKWERNNLQNDTKESSFISLQEAGCGYDWGSPSEAQNVYCDFDTDSLYNLEDMGPVESITLLLMGTAGQESSVLIGE